MAKINNTQDRELMETMTLSWEALPELAKDRWEQAVGYDLAVETQLAKAKSTRAEAELERQWVANEILEATREVCKSIIIDSKRSLEKARRAESNAENKLLESQNDQEQSQALKVEAEAIFENARQRAEELVKQSRAAAEREGPFEGEHRFRGTAAQRHQDAEVVVTDGVIRVGGHRRPVGGLRLFRQPQKRQGAGETLVPEGRGRVRGHGPAEQIARLPVAVVGEGQAPGLDQHFRIGAAALHLRQQRAHLPRRRLLGEGAPQVAVAIVEGRVGRRAAEMAA